MPQAYDMSAYSTMKHHAADITDTNTAQNTKKGVRNDLLNFPSEGCVPLRG